MTTQHVSSGISSSGLVVSSGNEVDVLNGGRVQSGVITGGDLVLVSSVGATSSRVVSGGGLPVVSAGGHSTYDTVEGDGHVVVSSGGGASDVQGAGGTLEVGAYGSASQVKRGGTALVDSGGSFSIAQTTFYDLFGNVLANDADMRNEAVVIASGSIGYLPARIRQRDWEST